MHFLFDKTIKNGNLPVSMPNNALFLIKPCIRFGNRGIFACRNILF